MTYGLMLWDADGNVTFDSRTAIGGWLADAFITAGAEVRTYPDFPGRAAWVQDLMGFVAGPTVSVDYALGYPRVTLPSVPHGWMVFIE